MIGFRRVWINKRSGLFLLANGGTERGGAVAKVEFRQKLRTKPESTYLDVVRRNVTSQAGEDGLIQRIFSMIGASNKWCVEFGAWDGRHFSNSWNLLANKNWRGVLIEGDSARCAELRNTHAGHDGVHAVNRFVGLDAPDTLDAILAETPTPVDFDFLSIDVDGVDWHIWRTLVRYRPRLVVIEFNPSIPNDVYFVQDADPAVHHGSSLLAMIELGKEKRYQLVATTPINALFVREDLFEVFEIADNDIDAMHSPAEFESGIFQLYDGTLMIARCRRLLWAQVDIEQEAIQVLPPERRVFVDKMEER